MIIKKGYMDRIRLDDVLLLKLATANGVRAGSIFRWCKPGNKKGNQMLTTASNLAIIAKHFEISDTEQLLEEETIEVGTTN